jgi:hypothetical protein
MLHSTEDIIKALEQTHGMIFLAAKALGCSHCTIYRRAKKVKAVRDVIDSQRGKMLDTAELKLENAILNGEPWAITLALKTIGKHRGYVERAEVTGAEGKDLNITLKWPEEQD